MNPTTEHTEHTEAACFAPPDTASPPPLGIVVERWSDPASARRIADIALDWFGCSRERCLVYLFGGMLVNSLFPGNPFGILGGVVAILGAAKLFMRARVARTLRKTDAAEPTEAITIRFTDSRLEVSGSSGAAQIPWPSLATSYVDGGDFFVLFRNKKCAFSIYPGELSAVGRDRLLAIFAANGIVPRRRGRWYRAKPWIAILLLAVAAFFAQRKMVFHAESAEPEPHAESAEDAEPKSHAENAEGAE